MAFLLCSDFSIFPDNTQLGPAFTLSAMDFLDVLGGSTSFVNLTNGELGLQFPDAGLDVTLPTAVSFVRFRIRQFNTPFTVEALDGTGATVSTFNMAVPNTYLNFGFTAPGIAAIRFRGGGDEGALVSLCILVI